MTLPINLAQIAAAAEAQADDLDAFAYYIELQELSDAAFDAQVEAIAAPIIAAIDCTQCGNCCRSLDIYLTPTDVPRLAAALTIPLDAVQSTYIDHARAATVEEWGVFKTTPCPFLAGNLCCIYAHRPDACRAYPEFTPDFRWQIRAILGGYGSCPIIYHVIEALKSELGW